MVRKTVASTGASPHCIVLYAHLPLLLHQLKPRVLSRCVAFLRNRRRRVADYAVGLQACEDGTTYTPP